MNIKIRENVSKVHDIKDLKVTEWYQHTSCGVTHIGVVIAKPQVNSPNYVNVFSREENTKIWAKTFMLVGTYVHKFKQVDITLTKE